VYKTHKKRSTLSLILPFTPIKSSSLSIQGFPMSYTAAERRRVFLAYRTVFNGTSAHIWKTKKVREVVQSHSKSFEPLIRGVDFEKVVDVVKSLLDQSIFESELQAKIAFPEPFRSSPARDVQRSASEVDAARSEAEALEVLSSAGEQGP
jgi:hypothetical protein